MLGELDELALRRRLVTTPPPDAMIIHRPDASALTFIPAALALVLLAACGGGGSSSDAGTTADTGTAGTTPAAPTAPTTPARLSGVVAYGAPLASAHLIVIDATGAAVGSSSTNATDGSYALTLNTATPTLPLLLQAAGHDATGRPLLLHSALTTLSATAVVNVTPFSDAAVALTLGTDPAKVFAQPAANAALLAGLSKVAVAGDFVKTLVKSNLSDAKVTSATTLDLFSDSAFSADKTGLDLALESLVVTVGSSARGADELQLANKLGSALTEVTVDLATARTEIAKATGSAPAAAITSTLKQTTSPSALLAKLATIDNLPAAINNAIAAGGRGSATTALTAAYVRHNGRTAAQLSALIASWADKNMQMGRMQVTGCADSPIAAAGCVRVAVAARLINASGAETGAFTDAVSVDAKTLAWSLVGNGQLADATVQAVAWLALDTSGAPLTNLSPNPRLGVQVAVDSAVASAKALLPGGHVLALVPCARPLLCVTSAAGATSALATGTPADVAVFPSSSTWLGTADTSAGAKYTVTLTPATGNAVARPSSLRSAFLAAPANSRFPALDGVGAPGALASTQLLAGRKLAWKAWAASNLDMRLTTVRVILAGATEVDPARVFEATPTNWIADSLDWAPTAVPAAYAGSAVSLSLTAVDSAGRLYTTSYADLPVN